MPFSDDAKNAMLDQLDTIATHLSVHTAYSASGANEATGGSPAYARQAVSFDASASGSMSLTAQEDFDLAAATYGWVGLWSALTSGTFYGMFPLGGASANGPKVFTGESTDDVVTCVAHGFSDTDTVVVFGASLPGGYTAGTVYFVRDATTDTFKLAATSGGTAITISSDGAGIVQAITQETLASQGTLSITDMDLGLNLLT
jgi:hypothetical protein